MSSLSVFLEPERAGKLAHGRRCFGVDHGRDANQFSSIDPVDLGDQSVAAVLGVVKTLFRLHDDQVPLLQVEENLSGAVVGNVERAGQFIDHPALWTAVPEKKKRFEVRNAVDEIENETVDF